MHDETPELDPETSTLVASLVTAEGWPLINRLFADSEFYQLQKLRAAPLDPQAQAAAVKLAHIEELRDMFRSITPPEFGDPFDVVQRLDEAGHGPDPDPEPDPDGDPLGFDDEDYNL
jgi:hypothetical protein